MSTPSIRTTVTLPVRLLHGALHIYKWTLSPLAHALTGSPGACRFQPTCSEYATLALALHGPGRGFWLALQRLLRCQPLSRGGFDPVPHPDITTHFSSPSRPVARQKRSGHLT